MKNVCQWISIPGQMDNFSWNKIFPKDSGIDGKHEHLPSLSNKLNK